MQTTLNQTIYLIIFILLSTNQVVSNSSSTPSNDQLCSVNNTLVLCQLQITCATTRWFCPMSTSETDLTCTTLLIGLSNVSSCRNYTYFNNNFLNVSFMLNKSFNMDDRIILSVCFPLFKHFKQSIKWKLTETEVTFDENLTVLYDPHFTKPECNQKSYKENVIGEYKLDLEGKFVYVRVPDCWKPPIYEMDIFVAIESAISSISLAIAIILELIVPQSEYDRRPLICHMFSLFVTFVVVVIRCVTEKPDGVLCYIISVSVIYFFATAITWMTVIVFDMWRHLHVDRILNYNPRGSNLKYSLQSLFAWGVPAVYLTGLYPLRYIQSNTAENCLSPFFYNQFQTVAVYAIPELLQIGNFLFFAIIVYNVSQFDKKLGAARVHGKNPQKLWRFFLRFMIAVGVCALVSIPQFSLEIFFTIDPYIDLLLSMICHLQGFYLFFIYDCNKFVWKKLWRKIKKASSCC